MSDELLADVRAKGDVLRDRLAALPGVEQVRGRGLLIGASLDRPAEVVVDGCRERGLLVGAAGPDVLRLTPPLTSSAEDLEHGLRRLEEVMDG